MRHHGESRLSVRPGWASLKVFFVAGSQKAGTDQLRVLKRLQEESERLEKAISDLTQDKLILAEAAKGNHGILLAAVLAPITYAPGSGCPHVDRILRFWVNPKLTCSEASSTPVAHN
ncbi:hypothetical protein IT775_19295 [Thalassobius aquimarinus]|uniref:Transposase n=1 Tax=Thalassovita aquimarina TaxID=2785917 RepID=A0ABS5HWD5_9RHOB|nr:hypothetical protein [Thalassovita aquimarina]